MHLSRGGGEGEATSRLKVCRTPPRSAHLHLRRAPDCISRSLGNPETRHFLSSFLPRGWSSQPGRLGQGEGAVQQLEKVLAGVRARKSRVCKKKKRERRVFYFILFFGQARARRRLFLIPFKRGKNEQKKGQFADSVRLWLFGRSGVVPSRRRQGVGELGDACAPRDAERPAGRGGLCHGSHPPRRPLNSLSLPLLFPPFPVLALQKDKPPQGKKRSPTPSPERACLSTDSLFLLFPPWLLRLSS